jgi:DNA-binding MarR family transcriptional regulator
MSSKLLSPQELSVWHAFKLMGADVLEKVEHDIAQSTGLSGSDFGVLSRLADLGTGELRQQALAESLGWDKSRLSHHLTRMQNKQLVDRREADARGVLVVLTKTGRAKLNAARPVHAESVRRNLLMRINEQQTEALVLMSDLLKRDE